jgi:hypothetical protein
MNESVEEGRYAIKKGLKPTCPPSPGCDKPTILANGNQRKGKIGSTLYCFNIEIGYHLLSLVELSHSETRDSCAYAHAQKQGMRQNDNK